MRTDDSVVSRPSGITSGRQTKGRGNTAHGKNSFGLLLAPVVFALLAVAVLAAPPLAGAQAVTVTVSPGSAQVVTGSSLQLTSTVNGVAPGTQNQLVTWSLSGPGCSGLSCGTINAAGQYTAPASAPNPPTVLATATSIFNPGASGSATLTVVAPAPVIVTVTPSTFSIKPGAQQQFSATVTGTSSNQVVWGASGAGCFGIQCGTIDFNGVYTAPTQVPNPAVVSVTATLLSDQSKSGSAKVTIGSGIAVSVTPPTPQILLGQQQQFAATVTGSNNTVVNWTVSGAGCAGATCGSITAGGLYTAPAAMPGAPTVTITATSVADVNTNGSATLTLFATPSVSVQPHSVHVNPGAKQAFTATVVGVTDQLVAWSLSGAGCVGIACGTIDPNGNYVAPGTIPNPNTVTVTAASLGQPNLSGTATVFVGSGSPVRVAVTPSPANVAAGTSQQFTAKVTGTNNTAVTWSLAGLGCTGSVCGTITSTGLYTAPATLPKFPAVEVIATSQADPTQSGNSFVSILPNIVVTVTPSPVQLKAAQQQQFTATVTGTLSTAVTWSLSGAGCSGAACGTVTSSGLYTAPAQLPNPPVVTVTATSQADSTKSGSATVLLGTPIVVTVTPANVNVTTSGQQKFVAAVTGTKNTAVTWSLTGPACPGSCGSIDSTGLYTAPATVPNSNVTVVATSQANGVSSGTATVTVISTNVGNFKGQFAFLFRGTDASGFFEAAGSFVADGQGHLLSGVEDINHPSGPATNVAFTGTYTVSGDNRGTLNWTNAHGTFTYAFALNGKGNLARMIEVDASGRRGTGIMQLQDSTAFNNFGVAGGYAASLVGADSGGTRLGVLMSIFPSGTGSVNGSSLDANDGGQNLATVTFFNGTYSVTGNGRGAMALSIPGFGGGKFNFVIYVISANQFFLISVDPVSGSNPLFSGTALSETGTPFATSSFNGDSIFYETGWTNGAPDVSVGQMTFDGTGIIGVQYDENAGGQVQIDSGATGTYSVAGNGRSVLNLVNSATHTVSTVTVYAISPNSGFIMDMTASVRSGYFENQVVKPRFGDVDMLGNYTLGSTGSVGANTPVFTGALTFNANGNMGGNEDEDPAGSAELNQLVSGTYAITPVSTTGRGNVFFTLPQSDTVGVWVATFSRAYGIPTTASDTAPTVLVLEQ